MTKTFAQIRQNFSVSHPFLNIDRLSRMDFEGSLHYRNSTVSVKGEHRPDKMYQLYLFRV